MSGLSLGRLVSNLKSVALTVFDLLAFNAQNFRGSRDTVTPPFGKIFGVMSGLSLGRLVSNLKSVALTIFELLAFNSHDRPLRTHKHTSNERIISAIHFVHLAEIIILQQLLVPPWMKHRLGLSQMLASFLLLQYGKKWQRQWGSYRIGR